MILKCRKCREPAVVNMRQHKLPLCAVHFLEWLPEQTQRTIEKYRMFTHTDRILVAVSGGKDSLSVWDILRQLGYQADGMTLQLGIDEGLRTPTNRITISRNSSATSVPTRSCTRSM